MPRIRTIKPEFFQDEKLAELPASTRLVFLGLISMADDAGRLLDNIKVIDAFVFPCTDETCRVALNELAALGRIKRGYTDSNQAIIEIANFLKHQKIAHPSAYTLAPLTRVSRESHEKLVTLSTTNYLLPTTNDPPSASASEPTPDYRTEFATLRSLYPKREGAQGWPQAEAKYIAHRKAGATYEAVEQGVRNYAALCAKNGSLGTQYVCQALTFFGPQRRWEDEYTPAPSTDPVDADLAALLAESSGGYAA